jgi:tight adherence protein B
MALKLIILLLIFSSAGLLTSQLYPFGELWVRIWEKKRLDKITPKLDRMFLDVSLKKLLLLDLLSPLILGGVGLIFVRHFLGALVGVIFGLMLPSYVIKNLEKVRCSRFSSQIVDGLMILSSSLKAGLSLLQAFDALVEEMPTPISQEFSLVVRQVRMGVTLEEALNDLKKRMPVEELDLIVTAVLVAQETGGDITETFSKLVFTIREKNKLMGRIKALTVQGRLQGWIMGALPVLFTFFVFNINKNYFDFMLKDKVGQFLIVYAVVSELVGIIVIRILSKIDI